MLALNGRALEASLMVRPTRETVRDTFKWATEERNATAPSAATLSADGEARVLAALRKPT